jgi:exonuclease SbcD
MRLVHLSDLHLGYRQYQRLTPTGINQRESDVAGTFRRAIDQIIALRPDLLLIAGDLFHSARPSNAAIVHAFGQFAKLRGKLPDAKVVLIAGNHDTPRTTETGSILGLFKQLDISVAFDNAHFFKFEDRDLAVLAIPDVPGQDIVRAPDRSARYNVLLMHADVEDVVPRYYAEMDRAAVRLTRRDLDASRWSYVALGHYHVHQKVEANAYYSGSTDYTSLNVWGDLADEEERGVEGKGFIEFDLVKKSHRFHTLTPSRAFLELKPIRAHGMTVAEINAAIRKSVDKARGGIDDKVVRLVIHDVPRHVVRELDHRALREFKQRALSFQLVTRKPETSRPHVDGAPRRKASVVDVVREKLQTREIPADLDRDRLIELGLKYLTDAEELPVADMALTLSADPE